eukprot:CAMPEP_0173389540 /NCGR_PEP_ID=MMETSP1356-20130122/12529_1 /TAXON_ID=77927 ORGANISM="Hemiselmis virescens, Strain PCC157" /NCGR_SAMPLE_ID=MMETSP1356 /ASSEMBLY_ACC=CAM_ASM_000847 /LENGTH=444 /DNA_ID=CAMNT_0014346737 /DNA_START=13 /DNA_END=1347 /DNA_ORIENTATION=-
MRLALLCALLLCLAQAQAQPAGVRLVRMPQGFMNLASLLGGDCDDEAKDSSLASSPRRHHSLLDEAFGGAPSGGHFTVRLLPVGAGHMRLGSLLDELMSGDEEGDEDTPAVAPRRAGAGASPFSGPFSGPMPVQFMPMGSMRMMGAGGAMPVGGSSMTHITMDGDKVTTDTTTTDAKGHQHVTHTTEDAKGGSEAALDKALKAAFGPMGGPAGEMSGITEMIEGLLNDGKETASAATPTKPAAQPEEDEEDEEDAADSDEGDEADEEDEEADQDDEDQADEDQDDEESLDEQDDKADDDSEEADQDGDNGEDEDDEDEESPLEVSGKDLDSLDDSTKDAVKGAVAKAMGVKKEKVSTPPTPPAKKKSAGSPEEQIAAEMARNKAAEELVKKQEATTMKHLKKVEGVTAQAARSAAQKAEEEEQALGRLAALQRKLERQQQAVVA